MLCYITTNKLPDMTLYYDKRDNIIYQRCSWIFGEYFLNATLNELRHEYIGSMIQINSSIIRLTDNAL